MHKQLIFSQTYKVKLDKINSDGEKVTTSAYLPSNNRRLMNIEELGDEYDEAVNEVNHKLGLYMGEASGWIMDKVENVYVNITSYSPIRGSCHIDTPARLANKKSLINIKNKDNRCFEYAIRASEFPSENTKIRLIVIQNILIN